jgi:hypothetical protein
MILTDRMRRLGRLREVSFSHTFPPKEPKKPPFTPGRGFFFATPPNALSKAWSFCNAAIEIYVPNNRKRGRYRD